MIDINTLISNALIAAVQQATAPLVERIAALEVNIAMMQNSIDQKDTRIAALENNPAQGVDLTPATITADAFVTHLDNQEWFWSKISDFVERDVSNRGIVSETRVEEMLEEAMDDHTSTYDHDEFVADLDSALRHEVNLSDYIDIEDAVRDALREMSFEVRVS